MGKLRTKTAQKSLSLHRTVSEGEGAYSTATKKGYIFNTVQRIVVREERRQETRGGGGLMKQGPNTNGLNHYHMKKTYKKREAVKTAVKKVQANGKQVCSYQTGNEGKNKEIGPRFQTHPVRK